mgnify:CR=1 FL=1
MPDTQLTIFTDGGARGNPGPAGIGFVIKSGDTVVRTGKEYIGHATNNQAEYKAVLAALTQAKQLGAQEIDVYADSELVVNQLSRKAKIKNENLGSLFVQIWNLLMHFKRVSFHHIPREQNSAADSLVNQAIDQAL